MKPSCNYFGVLFTANIFVAAVLCACLPDGSVEAADSPLGGLPDLGGLTGGLGGVGQQLGGLGGGLGGVGGGLGLPGLGGKSCKCATKYEPVCASDGNTYDNECLFKCAAKLGKKSKNKGSKGLKISKKGACVEIGGSKSG